MKEIYNPTRNLMGGASPLLAIQKRFRWGGTKTIGSMAIGWRWTAKKWRLVILAGTNVIKELAT